MTITVEAVYERGVLRLMEPIALTGGTRVDVIVIASEPVDMNETPANILATIAVLPLEVECEAHHP